jgi:predicted kinase
MGCGKSTLADQLSFELGLKIFNSDIVRKQLAGLSPATSVRDSFGEGLYNTERNHETYRQLVLLAQHELESRRSVIIDASFSKAVERARFENLASTHKADFIILFVQCDPKEQNNRLKERSNKQSVSDGRIELLEQQRQVFEPPDESDDNVVLCRSCEATGQQLQLVYERLKQP